MIFELSEEQCERIKQFEDEQDRAWMESHKDCEQQKIFGHPYYGAIGGSMTYSFTPTSIGTFISVKHATGAVLKLEDGTGF